MKPNKDDNKTVKLTSKGNHAGVLIQVESALNYEIAISYAWQSAMMNIPAHYKHESDQAFCTTMQIPIKYTL
jgi:hypothetical protein